MPGTFVQRKFPVGTFDPRSENTGERKVPEPLLVLSLVLQCIRACSLVPDLVLHVKYFFITFLILICAIYLVKIQIIIICSSLREIAPSLCLRTECAAGRCDLLTVMFEQTRDDDFVDLRFTSFIPSHFSLFGDNAYTVD